jgi:hypothetical protein
MAVEITTFLMLSNIDRVNLVPPDPYVYQAGSPPEFDRILYVYRDQIDIRLASFTIYICTPSAQRSIALIKTFLGIVNMNIIWGRGNLQY